MSSCAALLFNTQFESPAGQRHICFERIVLKRVNPATAWSTRPSPYAKRHMFSQLTHRRLSAVNLLVNVPLALRVDSRLSAPGPGPPAARSSSSSESSGMMHPRPAALPAPSQRLAPARIAAGWITAGSGPSRPSRPWSMLELQRMSARLPSLPFSHRRAIAGQTLVVWPPTQQVRLPGLLLGRWYKSIRSSKESVDESMKQFVLLHRAGSNSPGPS